MCGCGHVAPNLVAAALMILPSLERITIVDTLDASKTVDSLKDFTEEVDTILEECGEKRHLPIQAATDLQSVVEDADIIFTATPSYQPFIRSEWVQAGTHLSCIGSDMAGKEEIDKEIFSQARVFGDDESQCLAVGECEIPYQAGLIQGLEAEIGQVIAGLKDGRLTENDITIFDSTGIALQDLGSAALILKEAEERNLGALAEL